MGRAWAPGVSSSVFWRRFGVASGSCICGRERRSGRSAKRRNASCWNCLGIESFRVWTRPGLNPLLESPIALARFHVKLRPVLRGDADGMILAGLRALRLKADQVLAMHLRAHQLNRLFQSVLLHETQGSPARGLCEQVGQIRLM